MSDRPIQTMGFTTRPPHAYELHGPEDLDGMTVLVQRPLCNLGGMFLYEVACQSRPHITRAVSPELMETENVIGVLGQPSAWGMKPMIKFFRTEIPIPSGYADQVVRLRDWYQQKISVEYRAGVHLEPGDVCQMPLDFDAVIDDLINEWDRLPITWEDGEDGPIDSEPKYDW